MAISNSENINSRFTLFSDASEAVGIKFLQGTQASLNALISAGTATEGAFYLTSDTSRFYIGRKENKTGGKVIPVPVNEGVTVVENRSGLSNDANVGDFYYIESDNILCVCSYVTPKSGDTGVRTCHWTQLNPDTHISAVDTDLGALSDLSTG